MRSFHCLIGLGALGVAVAAACSSSSGDDRTVNPYGSAASAGSNSGGAAGTGVGGAGALSSGGFGGTIDISGGTSGGGQPPRDACAGDFHDGQQKPLDMFIMFDQSGSMGQNGNARWDAVKNALTAFVQSGESAGIGVGIAYFPLTPPPCTAPSDTCVCILGICLPLGGGSCEPLDYARPDVPIEPLPPVAQKIVDSLNRHTPAGGTPTVPALDGAVQYATFWAQNHPDHKTIVVLATDGEPSGCNSNIPGVSAIAAQALAANPSVQTYVIGVGDTGNLNAIAQAGGTTQAFVVSDQNANEAFLAAMNQIRGTALACDYAIPLPEGRPPNFDQVNMYFGKDGTETLIYKVDDASKCDPVNGGWFYDNPDSPTQLRACPATCDVLKLGQGSVRIEVGCESIRPPS